MSFNRLAREQRSDRSRRRRATAAVALAAVSMLAAACGSSLSQDAPDGDGVAAIVAEDGSTIVSAGDATAPVGEVSSADGEQPGSDGEAMAETTVATDASGADDSSDGSESSSTSEGESDESTTTPTSSGDGGSESSSTSDGDGAPAGDVAAPTAIDWWGCWHASDAQGADGGTPSNGSLVAVLPNCATGPSSIGAVGDMSHPDAPIFRSRGANGHPAIEFTFEGDTLLQTNGGRPWSGDAVMSGGSGVTVAWVGMTTDIRSHNVKYLVTGLSDAHRYPQLLAEGEGLNRFAGWAGGSVEARSSNGTIVDGRIIGVIMYFSADGTASVIEVDNQDRRGGQDSVMNGDVHGLTLGNWYRRDFSTTDHEFIFLGLRQGEMSEGEKADFWRWVDGL